MDIGGGLPVACLDKDVDAEKIMKSINDCLVDFEDVEVWLNLVDIFAVVQ